MANDNSPVPIERIENSILLIRGQKVMLDRDLASLYGVSAKALNQAVKRNIGRFPDDFMFQLTAEEVTAWLTFKKADRSRSQIVTLKRGKNIKYRPFAFTEHGILMLSSVLKSERAVQINILIMRTFVKMREMLASNAELNRRLDALERKHDAQFKIVFDAIRQILMPPEKPKRPMGFQVKERKLHYTATKRN
jgi:ORF6N domain